MGRVDRVLRVNAQAARGPTEMIFTEQSVSFTEARTSGMEDVPDMLGIMLGTALDSRKRARGKFGSSIDLPRRTHPTEEPPSPDEGLGSYTIEVPYTSIIRCYVARPGRFRRAKLAFDCYDPRRGKVASREFLLDPREAAEVEGLLSSLIPDRLEVH